jgi:hypothetical protein
VGTVFGVILIPGLYFIFAHVARLEKFLRIGAPSEPPPPPAPLPLSEVSLASLLIETLEEAGSMSATHAADAGEPHHATTSRAPVHPRAEEESRE